MKKLTLSALAAIAVAGTSFAGPTVVMSKEYKAPCVTPCFRDQEWQLDLFYSFNDAEHQGNQYATDRFLAAPAFTPLPSGLLPGANALLTDPNAGLIPAGSVVTRAERATVKLPQYFNDGSGGGVGMNYFFAKYFGVSIEGNWWNGARGGFDGIADRSDYVALSGPVDVTALAAAAVATRTSVAFIDGNTLVIRDRNVFGRSHRTTAQQLTGNVVLRYPFEGPICWAPYIFGGGGGIFDGKSTGFGDIGLGVEFRVTPNMGFFTDWRWEFTGGNNGDNGFHDTTRIRELARVYGLDNLRVLKGDSRNDVSVTRVGVRFVF